METRTLADEALEAANADRPRIFRITNLPPGDLRFFTVGCHGSGKKEQREVAVRMNQIAQQQKDAGEFGPIEILFIGDNIYPDGTAHPNDPAYKKQHYDMYRTDDLPAIKNVPSASVLGNHDVNQSSGADEKAAVFSAASYVLPVTPKSQGLKRGVNQIAHTFYAETSEEIAIKKKVFDYPLIPYKALSSFPWIMPTDFYAQIFGQMQIFFLNSNDILRDYLKYISGKTKDLYNQSNGQLNQAAWLAEELLTAVTAGRECIFLQHHPYMVCGKRSYPDKFDTRQYLTQVEIDGLNDELKKLNAAHVRTESMNELIAAVYRQMGVNAKTVKKIICAHEHMIGLKDDDEPDQSKRLPPQLTIGSGGGDIEERKSWRDTSHYICEKDFGFAQISFDPNHPATLSTDIFTLKNLHLHCGAASGHRPVVQPHSDFNVMTLRKCVLSACDEYFNCLRAEEFKNPKKKSYSMLGWAYGAVANTATHYMSDAKSLNENNIAQHLQTYFNQYKQPDFAACIQYLSNQCKGLPQLASLYSPVTFYSILNDALTEKFGQDWQNNPIVRESVGTDRAPERSPSLALGK